MARNEDRRRSVQLKSSSGRILSDQPLPIIIDRFRYFLARLRMVFVSASRRRQQLKEVYARAKGGIGLLEVLFALLDLVGFFDLYEALSNALTPGIRSLTKAELHFLRPIFEDSVPWHLIRIDESAWIGPRWGNLCYVSFHTINSWGPMPAHVLVHEVVHVWQYTHRGAAYIPRALVAQRSEMGYDYGGLEPLRQNNCLEDFNYEQQADIIEDAFRLSRGYRAQWHGLGAEVLSYYYPYLREILAAT